MTSWGRWRAASGFVGWLVMAAGGVIALIGIFGLIAGADPSPTAAAILAGATLIGVGATLTGEERPVAGLEGGLWRAVEGETRSHAAMAAAPLPKHLGGLLIDLALGNAAARYIDMSRALTNQIKAAGAVGGGGGGDAITVMAAAVREMARTSVQEASEAVAALHADGVSVASEVGPTETETETMSQPVGFYDDDTIT